MLKNNLIICDACQKEFKVGEFFIGKSSESMPITQLNWNGMPMTTKEIAVEKVIVVHENCL